jgi:hypothetical protein
MHWITVYSRLWFGFGNVAHRYLSCLLRLIPWRTTRTVMASPDVIQALTSRLLSLDEPGDLADLVTEFRANRNGGAHAIASGGERTRAKELERTVDPAAAARRAAPLPGMSTGRELPAVTRNRNHPQPVKQLQSLNGQGPGAPFGQDGGSLGVLRRAQRSTVTGTRRVAACFPLAAPTTLALQSL